MLDCGLRACLPGRFDREDRAGAGKRERLRHEIILAADAAHDLSVFEAVGNRGPHQGRHHRAVDEAGVDAGAPLGVLVAIELVGEGYRHHLDPRDLLGRHLAQRAIERFRPEKERPMQHGAVDLALENAGVDQAEKGRKQHLADAVEALFERSGVQRREVFRSGHKPLHDPVKLRDCRGGGRSTPAPARRRPARCRSAACRRRAPGPAA